MNGLFRVTGESTRVVPVPRLLVRSGGEELVSEFLFIPFDGLIGTAQLPA